MGEPTLWLAIATSGALLGSTATLIAVLTGYTRIAFLAAVSGIAIACFGDVIVAALLAGDPDAVVRMSSGSWISFAVPRSPAIVFGLEATLYKSAFVAVTGAILGIALWVTTAVRFDSSAENQILSTSLLYAGATVFTLAPNLFQALVGWCMVSLMTTVLIRLLKVHTSSAIVQTDRADETHVALLDRSFRTVARFAEFGAHLIVDLVWKSISCRLPNWIGEQIDHLQHETVSLQLIATIAGAFAIVLTWLI